MKTQDFSFKIGRAMWVKHLKEGWLTVLEGLLYSLTDWWTHRTGNRTSSTVEFGLLYFVELKQILIIMSTHRFSGMQSVKVIS